MSYYIYILGSLNRVIWFIFAESIKTLAAETTATVLIELYVCKVC